MKPYTSVREMFPGLAKELDDEIATLIAEGKYEHDGMLYTHEEILDLLFGVPAAEPFIGPIQSFSAPGLCACGAELMTERAVWAKMCGDGQGLWCQGATKVVGSLDQRIAEAQPPKVDKDPTEAWGAGQTPGYEWP